MEERDIRTRNGIGYEPPELKQGYSDQSLYLDIGGKIIDICPIDAETKVKFSGGKGYCLKLLSDAVSPTAKWNDPDNEIVIAAGALAGTPVCGSGKAIATSLSPLSVQKEGRGDKPIDSNFGSGFGTLLKHAGFDALEIQGKSGTEVVILIDSIDQRIEILEINDLPDDSYKLSETLTEYFCKGRPRQVSVVTTGRGAKNTLMGCLNASYRSHGRINLKQAGRGGIGTVMADKNLKAIVVRCGSTAFKLNNFANPKQFFKIARVQASKNIKMDKKQNLMRVFGTAHIPPHVNANNVLPCDNFQRGADVRADRIGPEAFGKIFEKGESACCKGCTVACSHNIASLKLLSGPDKGKIICSNGPEYETIAAFGSNLGIFNPKIIAEANYYCDKYGIDTISAGVSIAYAVECFEKGFIDETHTGGLKLRFGNWRAILALLHKMAKGSGFGKIVGMGVERMKHIFLMLPALKQADAWMVIDIAMASKGLEFSLYVTRESLAQRLGYGCALKGAHHDEAWLVFMDRVQKLLPTHEAKAEALRWFPFWRTWFSLVGLCKLPWNDITPEDNPNTSEPAKVMGHVEYYADYMSAAFGREFTPDDLINMSERVYTFQRMFATRMGHGSIEDDIIPYRAMGPITEEEYEWNREYYDSQLREKFCVNIGKMSTKAKIKKLRVCSLQQYGRGRFETYKSRGWTEGGRVSRETAMNHGFYSYYLNIEFKERFVKVRFKDKRPIKIQWDAMMSILSIQYRLKKKSIVGAIVNGVYKSKFDCDKLFINQGDDIILITWTKGMTVRSLIDDYKIDNPDKPKFIWATLNRKIVFLHEFGATKIDKNDNVILREPIYGG